MCKHQKSTLSTLLGNLCVCIYDSELNCVRYARTHGRTHARECAPPTRSRRACLALRPPAGAAPAPL